MCDNGVAGFCGGDCVTSTLSNLASSDAGSSFAGVKETNDHEPITCGVVRHGSDDVGPGTDGIYRI